MGGRGAVENATKDDYEQEVGTFLALLRIRGWSCRIGHIRWDAKKGLRGNSCDLVWVPMNWNRRQSRV
jgi:hypothetical protein